MECHDLLHTRWAIFPEATAIIIIRALRILSPLNIPTASLFVFSLSLTLVNPRTKTIAIIYAHAQACNTSIYHMSHGPIKLSHYIFIHGYYSPRHCSNESDSVKDIRINHGGILDPFNSH